MVIRIEITNVDGVHCPSTTDELRKQLRTAVDAVLAKNPSVDGDWEKPKVLILQNVEAARTPFVPAN